MPLLEIPWAMKNYFKAKYTNLKPRGGSFYIYNGPLPSELKAFEVQEFSYGRWIEDEALIKGGKQPATVAAGSTIFKPRDHQVEGAKAIYKAQQAGQPGFLIADQMGLGKTLTTLVGISGVAKKEGYGPQNKALVLIVCPKGVIPVWRQTIKAYPVSMQYCRFLVLNYQQLHKLQATPPKAKTAKRKRTQNRAKASDGASLYNWNYIIFDEAHKLKNYPSSAASLSAVSIAKLNQRYLKGKSPFVVFSTATPGSSPLNFSVMANWIAPLIAASGTGVTPASWGDFLSKQGFSVTKGKLSWNWIAIPWYGKGDNSPEGKRKQALAEARVKNLQRKDAMRIGKALKKPGAPFIRRSPVDIAGWPEQQFIPLPIELPQEDRTLYEEAWSTFRSWLRLTPAKSDPKAALVQMLRYRQKASMLKVNAMIDQVVEAVEDDKQVFISVEFMDTIDKYKEILTQKKISVAEISGRNVGEREQERLRFQKGHAKVVLCTVVEGISLHAGESLPDGSKATANDRITILHDLRSDPLSSLQSSARAHRDGSNSLTFIPMIEDSIEERVTASFIQKQANTKTMVGESQSAAEALENLFRTAVSGS